MSGTFLDATEASPLEDKRMHICTARLLLAKTLDTSYSIFGQ
jgi:hypothetical protein